MIYLKIDKNTLSVEKTIYAAIYISFFISILFLFLTFDNYIPIRYENNWNSKIITDIKFIPNNETCTSPYEDLLLGFWSGFDESCYCKHSISNETYAFSGKCQDLKSGFSCNKITKTPMIKILNYLGGKFCIKKTDFTFMELYNNFTQSLKINGNQLKNMDDKPFFEFKFNEFKKNDVLKNMLPNNIIIDIKITEKEFIDKHKGKVFDGKNYIDLDNYKKNEIKIENKKINFIQSII